LVQVVSGDVVVIEGGGLIVIENEIGPVEAPRLSVSCRLKTDVPVPVGVPPMTPLVS